jgi:hypothetical protein
MRQWHRTQKSKGPSIVPDLSTASPLTTPTSTGSTKAMFQWDDLPETVVDMAGWGQGPNDPPNFRALRQKLGL